MSGRWLIRDRLGLWLCNLPTTINDAQWSFSIVEARAFYRHEVEAVFAIIPSWYALTATEERFP